MEIQATKVITVEGYDDEYLVSELIAFLGLNDIQVVQFQGNTQWANHLAALIKTPGFEIVESLGIIQDSDRDCSSTFQSISNALITNGLNVPSKTCEITAGNPKIIVMLWPCYNRTGTLEDLCLQSVAEYPEAKCITAYFECLKSILTTMPKNLSKSKVKAFLASREEACPHLGIGAKKRYWPFEHDSFDEAKRFILAL
jgi:hypothetical protein